MVLRLPLSVSHRNGGVVYFRLSCALSGLRNASLAWLKLLRSLIRPLGLRSDDREPCLFAGRIPIKGSYWQVLILMYVDDLLIVSESEAAEMAVREAIGSKLTLKITGTIKPSYAGGGATSFIGRFIRRWPGSSVFEVGIDKEYLQPCFTAYGVQKGSSAVPDISAILDRTGETELSQEAYGLFRRALGKVLWFSQTRQDLKLIIGLISTQQSKPAQATEAALRALLRFLYDDRNVALQLPSEQLNEAFLGCPVEELERKVHVFPHASHAPYRFLARRGITGGALTYAGALVRGVAKTQGVVCLSSCEAELHALQHMEQEAVCFAFLLERVLTSLGNLRGGEHVDISLDSSKFEQDGETPGEQVQIDVISDSEAALAVIHAEDIPKRSRHVENRLESLRAQIAAGRMDFRWLAGTKNPADLYTKVLGTRLFRIHRERLGFCLQEGHISTVFLLSQLHLEVGTGKPKVALLEVCCEPESALSHACAKAGVHYAGVASNMETSRVHYMAVECAEKWANRVWLHVHVSSPCSSGSPLRNFSNNNNNKPTDADFD